MNQLSVMNVTTVRESVAPRSVMRFTDATQPTTHNQPNSWTRFH